MASKVKETVAQSKADELKLKGVLAELKGFTRAVQKKEWYVMVNDKEMCVD